MSANRSFERINYLLRPNKNVERKLIVRLLNYIGKHDRFDLTRYRYVGFGSMWFVDFILMHRIAGIKDLLTIERAATRVKRLEFNKPYNCIRVEIGKSTDVLKTLAYADMPLIVWLDYDDAFQPYMLDDLRILSDNCKSGDFVFMTVNAEASQLDMPGESQTGNRIDVLKTICDIKLIPGNADDRINRKDFPGLINEIVFNLIKSRLLEIQSKTSFIPLVNLTYSDNAKMTTYGGIFANKSDARRLHVKELKERFDFYAGNGQFEIQVPQLTFREKAELDKYMPSEKPPLPDQLPFELKSSEIEAYWKFYLQYPVFGEIYY